MLDRSKYLTADEVRRLLDAASNNEITPHTARRDLVIITLAINSGLRVSELSALNVGDLKREDGEWSVLDVRDSKGGKSRRVFISPEVGQMVWDYVTRHFGCVSCLPERPMFEAATRADHKRLTKRSIQVRFSRIAKRAGLRHSIHACRHTFALAWYAANKDVVSLQQQLGHKSIKTTMVYTSVPDEMMKAQAKQFPSRIPKRRLTGRKSG